LSRQVAGLVTVADRSGCQRALHLTQRRITPARHARVTIVDRELFAAGIDTSCLDRRTDLTGAGTEPVRALLSTLPLR
jgi:hypothetical protein